MEMKMPTFQSEVAADDDIQQPTKPTFKIFSNALKAYEREVDGTSRKFLNCTASSTTKDLHGDYMTDECVQGMAPQAKSKSMTIFLNHSYKWPEDIFGKTVDSKVVARTGPGGETVWDLDLEVMLNESNQRAVDTYTAIKDQGIKAGVSIGAQIDDFAFIDEEAGWWGGLEIKAVDLLEASIVGIPANQRSWVVNAMTALGAPRAVINKALGRAPDKQAQSLVYGDTDGVITLNGIEEVTNDVEASAAPEVEIPEDAADSSSEPEETTGETTAEAALSAATDAVVSMKSADKVDESLLEIVLSFLEGATEEVASLRKTVVELTAERDDARQDLIKAVETIETIAKTPIGRKAQFAAPIADFRTRFAGIYDEGILKLLEGDTENE
jgi:hypothetical protein